MAEILDEVEKGYGADELKGINKKIDALTTDRKQPQRTAQDKKEEEIAQAEKDKRTELSKKLDELRKERTARLEELGRGNKLVGQLIDLALLGGRHAQRRKPQQVHPPQRRDDRKITAPPRYRYSATKRRRVLRYKKA